MQFDHLKRREFITLLGSAVAWPLTARAQPATPMRRVGILMTTVADDPESLARIGAFLQGVAGTGLDRRPERAD
jgi:putative ABC transport system substrate-binding protein